MNMTLMASCSTSSINFVTGILLALELDRRRWSLSYRQTLRQGVWCLLREQRLLYTTMLQVLSIRIG